MKSNWRERYHKNFYGIGKDREIYSQDGSGISDLTTIEKFLEQELLTQRKTIGEAVRGRKMDDRPEIEEWLYSKNYTAGYNNALDDVLSIIEETK